MGRSTAEKVALIYLEDGLKLLQTAGSIIPVPGIGAAAAAALAILNLGVTARSNRDAFEGLGKEACGVMEVIVKDALQNSHDSDATLNERANVLRAEMEEIQLIVEEHLNRGRFRKFFLSKSDADLVKGCQRRLDRAVQLFGLRSHVGISQEQTRSKNMIQESLAILKSAPWMPQSLQQQAPPKNAPQSLPQQAPLHISIPSYGTLPTSTLQDIQIPTDGLTRAEKKERRQQKKALRQARKGVSIT
ncbi:hypothetical protein NP233_g7472 [Leucocoprinus birnbaumii]|uniref:Uncharacterized protein n=1 Tax=Leucocoprinus birnbaumii TaxID=56174 RepID=A0AAD5VP91_9AGAR|nr:hypothetical protein NP233_g7472 [Leucocoprinus birnbaumii]